MTRLNNFILNKVFIALAVLKTLLFTCNGSIFPRLSAWMPPASSLLSRDEDLFYFAHSILIWGRWYVWFTDSALACPCDMNLKREGTWQHFLWPGWAVTWWSQLRILSLSTEIALSASTFRCVSVLWGLFALSLCRCSWSIRLVFSLHDSRREAIRSVFFFKEHNPRIFVGTLTGYSCVCSPPPSARWGSILFRQVFSRWVNHLIRLCLDVTNFFV